MGVRNWAVINQDVGDGGLSLRGGSLRDGSGNFDGSGGSGERLTLLVLCLVDCCSSCLLSVWFPVCISLYIYVVE